MKNISRQEFYTSKTMPELLIQCQVCQAVDFIVVLLSIACKRFATSTLTQPRFILRLLILGTFCMT